jgi:hypothetical protein
MAFVPNKKGRFYMTWCKHRVFSQCCVLATLLLLQLTLVAHGQELPSDSAARTTSVTFEFVTTRDIGAIGSLSADSESDIWAASLTNSTALHFNGTTWAEVAMAKAGRVNKLAVLSPTNVWAVGQRATGRLSEIQHFNGSIWTVITSPHFGTGEELNSIKALSATNIYAVGDSFDSTGSRIPLVEHFNGTMWSIVPLPRTVGGELFDLALITPLDIWAVGGTNSGAGLILHFNGAQWSQVSAPPAGLFAVTALAANNVWAVGRQLTASTVIEHWNGAKWSVVSSPNTGATAVLNSVSAVSPNDVWAAGCEVCADTGGGAPALIEHWNGTAWTLAPSPVELGGVAANAVLAFPTGHIFVGGFGAAPFGPVTAIMEGKEGN